jgi:hypothetical protein
VFALRIAITCAILIPYWLIRQPRDTIEIFIVAFVGFAAGRLAVMAIEQNKKKQQPPPK